MVIVVAGVAAWRARRGAILRELATERDRHAGGYAGSEACATCHPRAFATWKRTFHRTMTVEVSPAHPEGVLGDFGGAVYDYADTRARMTRDGAGRFLMTFASGSGAARERTVEIVRAVGSRRYQQYLTRVGDALWRLPLAYHVEERRWFHMNGAFLTPDPPGPQADGPSMNGADEAADGRPVFGGMARGFDRHVTRWNDNCVFCHNVAPNPGRDPQDGTFRTTVAELGIACEACHGPGADHVRANASPARRRVLREAGAPDPTITHPGRLSPARAADVCGRCHGQRIADDLGPFLAHGDPFVPGEDLGLYSAPLWRDTPLHGDRTAFAARFWADGTPRLTAYEYQGLLLSACATRGTLTCITCHGMHEGPPRGQLRPAAVGDGACTTSCHRELAAATSQARHSHHAADGPGARCVGCHMPKIVYGVLDIHVSHRIERPDVARDVALGRPDACTLCHAERTRAWAVEAASRWWPPPRGDAAQARGGDSVGLGVGVGVGASAGTGPGAGPGGAGGGRRDLSGPLDALFSGDPIARAVAAEALGSTPMAEIDCPSPGAPGAAFRQPACGPGPGAARQAGLLAAMTDDRYPAVRHLAARALARLLVAPEHAQARALATAFDATASSTARSRTLAALRASLPGADAPGAAMALGAAPADGRAADRSPRAVADRATDIAIGE